jgi:hypothetical protein
MRFDRAVWSSMPGILAAGYMQQLLHDRVHRFTSALDAAGIPYGVCGGMAVIAWVSASNPDYVRNTKDVDVCMRRADLARAAEALKPHEFIFAEVSGVPMFLDGPDSTPKHAVHVVIAGEIARSGEVPVPDIAAGVRDAAFPWARVELDRLLTMKLIAGRMHDKVHIADLWRAKAIDRSWVARVPEPLQVRLAEWLDAAERDYGDSPH